MQNDSRLNNQPPACRVQVYPIIKTDFQHGGYQMFRALYNLAHGHRWFEGRGIYSGLFVPQGHLGRVSISLVIRTSCHVSFYQ
jgi:hypothetical protein